jgi:hypothetical protein
VAVLATIVITKKSNDPTSVAGLKEGECFTGTVNNAKAVNCAAPHNGELFSVIAGPDPKKTPFPGDANLKTQMGLKCTAAFQAYFGGDPQAALSRGINVFPNAPTAQNWKDGKTTTYCTAGPAPGAPPISGSLKGTGA